MESEELIAQTEAHVRRTPPRCIRELPCVPTELPEKFDDNFHTAWSLACSCGAPTGALLGYYLKDYNPDYEGPELFVGPLAFECSSCGRMAEILDTDEHGYSAEVSKIEGDPGGTKYRGEGVRSRFPCHCPSDTFRFVVGFVYWDWDLIVDQEELIEECGWPPEAFQRPEDFFNIFLMYATCTTCGEMCEPTQFGKL